MTSPTSRRLRRCRPVFTKAHRMEREPFTLCGSRVARAVTDPSLCRYFLIHVHIPLKSPFPARHVPKPGRCRHQGRMSVREAAGDGFFDSNAQAGCCCGFCRRRAGRNARGCARSGRPSVQAGGASPPWHLPLAEPYSKEAVPGNPGRVRYRRREPRSTAKPLLLRDPARGHTVNRVVPWSSVSLCARSGGIRGSIPRGCAARQKGFQHRPPESAAPTTSCAASRQRTLSKPPEGEY